MTPNDDPNIDVRAPWRTIEHDPNEFKKGGNGIWYLAALVLSAIWVATFLVHDIDRHSVFLGAATAGFVCCWAFDITGGKMPRSWRRKPPNA